MAIQFDQLPQEKPGGSLIEKGHYKATIKKAEMKAKKDDATKPPYLALVLTIHDNETGKAIGTVYDNITESDNDYVRFKLKRFIESLGIPLVGSIELKDLVKIANGKSIMVDIAVDEKAEPPKSVIDIFSAEIYYPLEKDDVAAPINAPDAVDAPTEPTTETSNTQY